MKPGTSRSCPKKEYLLKKMYDGARALHDFFEEMRAGKQAVPSDVAYKLKRQYKLTPNQRNYLDNVVARMTKAKTIVYYLERKFGLNEDRTFKDAQGLHKLLFGDDKKRVEAKSYGFGIGFTKGYWDGGDNSLGHIRINVDEPSLSMPIRKTISRLERGIAGDCGNLAFHLPSKARMKKNAEEIHSKRTRAEQVFYAIFGGGHSPLPEVLKEQVTEHELRHVIEQIIKDHYILDLFVETPAHLYSGVNISRGPERDFRTHSSYILRQIKNAQERLKKCESMNCPDVILNENKKVIEKKQARLDRLKQDIKQMPFLIDFTRKRYSSSPYHRDEDNRVKSYLFSTMPPHKLLRRLRETIFAQPKEIDLEDEI